MGIDVLNILVSFAFFSYDSEQKMITVLENVCSANILKIQDNKIRHSQPKIYLKIEIQS